MFTSFIGDLDGAQGWLDESLVLYRELDNHAGTAEVLADRGMVFQLQGDVARAGVDLHESLRLFRALGRAFEVGFGLHFLGTLAYAEGHVLQAGARWEESLTILRAEDARWAIATVLTHLAMLALDQGDDVRAGAYLAEGIRHLREQDERWQAIDALEVCARWVAQRGQRGAEGAADTVRAAQLFGAAEAVRETLGAPRLELFGKHYRRAVAGLRNHLDETACAAAWAEGRTLTLEQALAYALEDLPVTSTSEG